MVKRDENREVVIERELPFPRELVWKAITVPEHMQRWWGPDGFTIEKLSIDLRVGGAWIFDMIGPDGTRYPNHSIFKVITPPDTLIFDHGDGQRIWFEANIFLKKSARGTLVTLRHIFPDQASRDMVVEKYGAIEGGKQHLAKMEAYVRENLV